MGVFLHHFHAQAIVRFAVIRWYWLTVLTTMSRWIFKENIRVAQSDDNNRKREDQEVFENKSTEFGAQPVGLCSPYLLRTWRRNGPNRKSLPLGAQKRLCGQGPNSVENWEQAGNYLTLLKWPSSNRL